MLKRFLLSMLFGLGLICVMGCTAEISKMSIMTNGHAELEDGRAVDGTVAEASVARGDADGGAGKAMMGGPVAARSGFEPDAALAVPPSPEPVRFHRPLFVGNSLVEGMRMNCPDDYPFFCETGIWLQTLNNKLSLPDDFDCAIIEMGSNELGGYSRDRFTDEYRELVSRIGKPCFCLSIPPVCEAKSRYADRICNANVELYNSYIRDLCEETGAVYVDCSEFFGDVLDPAWTWDGLHLNSPVYLDWYTWVRDLVLDTDWGDELAA